MAKKIPNRTLLINLFKYLNVNVDELKILDNRDNRIVIQKVVYFAKKLDLGFTYEYNVFLHGPYSTELGRDYYSLTNEEVNYTDKMVLEPYKIKKLLWLKNQEPFFLEIASTLDFIIEYNSRISIEKAINHVFSMKEEVLKEHDKNIEYIKLVHNEIVANITGE
jgi:uncharacterized protein YwgA